MSSRARELFERSVEHVGKGQLRQGLGALLDALAEDPGHAGALAAAGRLCRVMGSVDDAELFEKASERPKDAEALYQLAYRLVDQDRPDVGARMLERCLQLDSGPQAVAARRELAFARLMSRDFAGSLEALDPLHEHADLAETERLDACLLAAEASFYNHERDRCRGFLARAEDMPQDDGQRQRLDALHLLVGRSVRWRSLDHLGLREWHFIQHAGVILKTAGGYFEDGSRQGRFDVLHLRPDMIAFLLLRLAHLLERFEFVPDRVHAVSPMAAPLAGALANRWNVPLADEPRGLLVASAAREFAPLATEVMTHRTDRRLFALNLDWERDVVVCPEVVGVMARRVLLPWETQYAMDDRTGEMREVPPDDRPPAEIAAELADLMNALPEDARTEFEAFYEPLVPDLVLGNENRHPLRRAFTRLSPCWSDCERAIVGEP